MGGYYLAANKLLGPDQAYSQYFSLRLQPKHINVKKSHAVLFAFWHWLHIVTGKHILLYKNNFAVSQGLKYLLIRGLSIIPMHSITILMVLHHISISFIWIPSKKNTLADMLSCGL